MKWPDYAALVARCTQQLRVLETTIPFDAITSFRDLCQQVAQVRQRPLEVLSIDLPVQMDGLWVATARTDYLIFASNAERVAQEHAICHELAHILLAHGPLIEDLALLLRGIDIPTAQRQVMAMRSDRMSTYQEQEAECFALLLAERLPFEAWGSMDMTPLPSVGPAERGLMERYLAALFPSSS